MNVHQQFGEDLALYALNALAGDERDALEKHLEECVSCRRELQQIRGDMALMALSSSGPVPPQRARQRLMAAIAREPRRIAAQPRRWRRWLLGFTFAALAVFAISLDVENSGLERQVAKLRGQLFAEQLELRSALQVVSTLTATDAMRVTLVTAKTPPQPQGKAIYLRNSSSLIFLASNMPAPPAQRAYELWLIPVSGAPIPAGVFKPDAHGSATVVEPTLPPNVEAKAFAITVEPEQGSSAPTSPIVMLGAGE